MTPVLTGDGRASDVRAEGSALERPLVQRFRAYGDPSGSARIDAAELGALPVIYQSHPVRVAPMSGPVNRASGNPSHPVGSQPCPAPPMRLAPTIRRTLMTGALSPHRADPHWTR